MLFAQIMFISLIVGVVFSTISCIMFRKEFGTSDFSSSRSDFFIAVTGWYLIVGFTVFVIFELAQETGWF